VSIECEYLYTSYYPILLWDNRTPGEEVVRDERKKNTRRDGKDRKETG